MGLTRGRALFAAALAILLVAAIAPQSRPLFRTQVETLAGQWRQSMESSWDTRSDKLDDVSKFLFFNDQTPLLLEYPGKQLDALIDWAERVNTPSAWATVVRYSLSDGPPLRPNELQALASEKVIRWEAHRRWIIDYATRRGADKDPDNAFFPLFRSMLLWTQDRRTEAGLDLARASRLPYYNDYVFDQFDRHRQLAATRLGPLSAEELVIINATLTLPHLSSFQPFGKLIQTQGTDRDKANAIRLAHTMAKESEYIIGILVAWGLTQRLIAPELSDSQADRAKQERQWLKDVKLLADREHDPSLIEDWQELLALRSLHRESILASPGDGMEPVVRELRTRRLYGANLLLSMLVLALTGLVSMLFRPRRWKEDLPIRSGATPHLLAAVSWIVIVYTLPRDSVAPSMLGTITALHVVLACQYGGERLARSAAIVWCAVVVALLFVGTDDRTHIPLLVVSLLTLPIALSEPGRRLRWATWMGMAISAAAAGLSMLAVEALVPAIAFFLSLWILHRRLEGRPVVFAMVLVLGTVGVGFLGNYLQFRWPEAGSHVLLIAVVTAATLAILLRPSDHPKQFGAGALVLSMLFLVNMGLGIVADQRGKMMVEDWRHEAERLRAKLPPPAKLAP